VVDLECGESGFLDRDFLDHSHGHAEPAIFQQITQSVAVYQVYGWGAVAGRLAPGIGGEGAGGNDQTLVGAAHHGPPKVAHRARTD